MAKYTSRATQIVGQMLEDWRARHDMARNHWLWTIGETHNDATEARWNAMSESEHDEYERDAVARVREYCKQQGLENAPPDHSPRLGPDDELVFNIVPTLRIIHGGKP